MNEKYPLATRLKTMYVPFMIHNKMCDWLEIDTCTEHAERVQEGIFLKCQIRAFISTGRRKDRSPIKKYLYNIYTKSAQRLRRWTNII